MKPEDLLALIDAGDVEGCLAFFEGATEDRRRSLAKVAVERLKTSTAAIPERVVPLLASLDDEGWRRIPFLAHIDRCSIRAAQVAVVATASPGALKKLAARALPPPDEFLAALTARRPPWAGELADWLLTRNIGNWSYVRPMVRTGICDRPRRPEYIQGMIATLTASPRPGGIREALLADPSLLVDEVWEVFEVEPRPGALHSFTVDRWTPPESRWELVLAGLAAEGRLSRTRLLDACLAGLERDFHETRARWLSAMHEALGPTVDERAGHVGCYLGLLGSRNPSTVKLALEVIDVLDHAGRVEPGAIVDAIAPALVARAKGTVASALDLLGRAADRDPTIRARAAIAAVEAMVHESPAVQASALDRIERLGDPADPVLAGLLRDRIDLVAASQRDRIAAWLGSVPAPRVPDSGLDELLARVRALDPEVAQRLGITAVIEAMGQGTEIPAVSLSEMDVPRLDPDRAIVPVADLDELIGLFTRILEDPTDPDELERLLDGVSRLCDRVPADFAVRTGPLRARAGTLESWFSGLIPPLCDLALRWTAGEGRPVHSTESINFLGFFARRVRALAVRAGARRAAPMLGTPTHRGGWIDPRVLVDRAREWSALGIEVDHLDGALALLRLAPDAGPRAEALRSASKIEGPYAEAVRYALGGEVEAIGPDPVFWIAAARARAPLEDDPRVEARHPGLGPDAGRSSHCFLRPGPHPQRDCYGFHRQLLIEREPPLPPIHRHDLPTVFLHDVGACFPRDDLRWIASVWPMGRDAFFATGAEYLIGFDWNPTDVPGLRPYLEALFDPDVPIRSLAIRMLAGAMSTVRPELRGLAVDALIAAVDDGRVDGRMLGEAIRDLLDAGIAKRSRLAEALREAGRISILHTRVVSRAVQIALLTVNPATRDLHLFLEPLREWLVELGEAISEPGLRERLARGKTSSKAGKLASEILDLNDRPDPSKWAETAARTLPGRLDRADRWTRSGGTTEDTNDTKNKELIDC